MSLAFVLTVFFSYPTAWCCTAAVIAARLRAVVYSELQYSMSAGIAVNKTMAKLGSSRNKPNKQTLLLPRAIPELMQVNQAPG